jgi:cell fate (sporulation/competence/biofilm development) regulator YmcA (YheA/YmcA/DUF963 family)
LQSTWSLINENDKVEKFVHEIKEHKREAYLFNEKIWIIVTKKKIRKQMDN